MTKKQADNYRFWRDAMARLGFSFDEAQALRRIEMTLHRWHERECGDGNGCIERDETTGKPHWLNAMTGRRYAIADREAGALRRLKRVMDAHPELWAYVQTDPRGGALYVGRHGSLMGQPVECAYSRGTYCNY